MSLCCVAVGWDDLVCCVELCCVTCFRLCVFKVACWHCEALGIGGALCVEFILEAWPMPILTNNPDDNGWIRLSLKY